jgi:hypothetical protein
MIYGISGAPIPAHLPYASAIQAGCQAANFPPCVAYAIAWRETISGEVAGLWVPQDACTVLSGDGGHGLFQLTSSFPNDWTDAAANIRFALEQFLLPGMAFFTGNGLVGDDLIRAIAAGFNSGNGTAWENHLLGNVDLGTAGNNYASSVLANYHLLITGQDPV